MLVCIICLVGAVILCRKLVKDGIIKEKKTIYILMAIELIGMTMSIGSGLKNMHIVDQSILRPEAGEGEEILEYDIETSDYSGPVEIVVEDKTLSDKEIEQLFHEAIEEIDGSILGENVSLDEIIKPINPRRSYCNKRVKATWEFGDGDVIMPDGQIDYTRVEKSQIIPVSVLLKCEKQEYLYSFDLQVMPPKVSSRGAIEAYVNKYIGENESAEVYLPGEVGSEKINWKLPKNYDGLLLMVLGVIFIIMMPYIDGYMRQKEVAARQQQMELEYPNIVGQLAIYIGVGLGIRDAIKRIGMSYENENIENCYGKKIMIELSRELQDGVSEYVAMEHMANKSNNKNYKKLALLLQQTGRQGNEKLVEALEREDVLAFEMRQNNAKKAGEEASTKLLFPMVGLFVVIMIMVIVPALLKMQSL
ncbi:MAG: type II secretion system F family protein [Lachnospiraceae bacterium]|nr:type II secretion system F family protein [Lachnospiraceae bacterium]